MTHPRWARQIPLECEIGRFSPIFHSYEKIYSSYDRDDLGFLLYVAVRVECHRPRHSSCPISGDRPKNRRLSISYLLAICMARAMHITIGSLSRRPPAGRRGRLGVCVESMSHARITVVFVFIISLQEYFCGFLFILQP